MEYTIREYNLESDVELIIKYLFTDIAADELRIADKFFLEHPESRKRFVVEIDHELHSTCVIVRDEINPQSGKFTLYSMVTSPQYRGKGISKALMDYVLAYVRENNGRFLLLSTSEDNQGAQIFYSKVGFKQYGKLPNVVQCGDKSCAEIFFYYELN